MDRLFSLYELIERNPDFVRESEALSTLLAAGGRLEEICHDLAGVWPSIR
jgi:hypothetical protein